MKALGTPQIVSPIPTGHTNEKHC